MWALPKKCGAVALQKVFVLIICVATFSFPFTYRLGHSVVYVQTENTANRAYGPHTRATLDTFGNGKMVGRSLNMHANGIEKTESRPTSLLARLLQLEEKMLAQTKLRKIGIIGQVDPSPPDALLRLRRRVEANGQTLEHVKEGHSDSKDVVIQGNYSIILCVGDPTSCPESIQSTSGDIQRMNRIVAVEKELCDPTKLCEVSKAIRQQTENHDNSFDPPCHIIPEDNFFIGDTSTRTYPVLVVNDKFQEITVLYNTTLNAFLERTSINTVASIWSFPTTPMTYQSGILLRLDFLVSSLRPLRLYIYPNAVSGPLEAIARPNLFGEQTSLGEILQYVGERYGLAASNHWWNTIQLLLMKALVFVEISSQSHGATTRCEHCFGVYSADVICVNIRNCFIIQVKPMLSDIVYSRIELLKPLLELYTGEKMVAMDVSSALDERQKSTETKLCQEEQASCDFLSDEILIYLLDNRRESLVHTDLIKIYPSTTSSIFTPFLSDLKTSTEFGDSPYKATYSLHYLIMSLEAYYSKLETPLPDNFDVSDDADMYGTDVDLDYQNSVTLSQDQQESCSRDPAYYKELSTLDTEPEIKLQKYTPDGFQAIIDYNIILIKILANARHCSCDVRFGDVPERARSVNFTLGLGETVIRLLIVDTTFPEPKIVRTVKLHVFRQPLGQTEKLSDRTATQTCSIRQDCTLPFSHSVPCGLQDTKITWNQFMKKKKPLCDNGDIAGAWNVPCTDCKTAETCYWKFAKWQPETCNYSPLSDEKSNKCLENKNLLFLGDSTNRGIMHYLIERVNGSLYSMDKTHTLKRYLNLNKRRTNMTFAYFPHFWLPVKHRPTFHKVLYQLIKRSLPIQNNSSTVLVVGGVHWLAKRHIDDILAALRRTGLSNITKVAKGLGAGFHQNIRGVRFVNKEDQAKLLTREREVLHYAKQYEFKVVGTFNMTMARYKDFTQGKCACHFHRISKRTNTQDEQSYTVDGDINAEYSQILLHNICNT